jgi:sensor c-di-GMP phosphodiesterase-like protein
LAIPSHFNPKIVVAVLGILVAGAPIVGVNAWLKKQGDDGVAITAAWALGSAEIQIGQTIEALQELLARNVDSCQQANIPVMRQAALATAPIKQIALIGPNGEILCTDAGESVEHHQVLTSAATRSSGVTFDVVRQTDRGEWFLRIRQSAGRDDKPEITALVPAGLLLPQAPTQGGRSLGYARIAMSDGTPVAASGVVADTMAHEAQFVDVLRSKRYPLVITVSMSRSGAVANYDDLRRIGMVIAVGIALVILLCALLFYRRRWIDPAAGLAKAIRRDEFVPYYQPIVDLQTGKLLGAEVLVRWRQPDGSLLEPNAFILLLESNGLVLDFTRKLMRRVKSEVGDAIARRPAMTISFNIAPRHFDDAVILSDVATIFEGSGVRLSQLVLELTECNEAINLAGIRRTIAALQRVGCKVAIDDVGAGHSGLSYILKLGADIIKIDKVFVDAIDAEGRSKAIIETLIDLARNMRMDIIAEGVETFDQVSYLRECGIGAAQGFVFAPPLPANTFLRLLDAMDPAAGAAAPGGREGARPAQVAAGAG